MTVARRMAPRPARVRRCCAQAPGCSRSAAARRARPGRAAARARARGLVVRGRAADARRRRRRSWRRRPARWWRSPGSASAAVADERLRAPAPWALGCAGAAFAAVRRGRRWLSGQASVLGYIKLDDSAIWLGLIAHVMEHGRDIAWRAAVDLAQLDLVNWLGNGLPGRVVHARRGRGEADRPGLRQRLPAGASAGYVAVLALGLCRARARPGRRGRTGGGGAVVAAQASLFAGYVAVGVDQGGRCRGAAPPVAIGVAAACGRCRWRRCWPAALLDTYGVGGVIWAGRARRPGRAAGRRGGRRRRRGWRWRPFGDGARSCSPSRPSRRSPCWAIDAEQTLRAGRRPNQEDLGKLFAPLNALQGAGTVAGGRLPHARRPALASPCPRWRSRASRWRAPPSSSPSASGAGRCRSWCSSRGRRGGRDARAAAPWIDAKVLAITAPCPAGRGGGGAGARRLPVPASAASRCGGACGRRWLVARDVYVAPRDVLTELRGLGRQLAGQGPTLVLNYEGYGTRYLLGPAAGRGRDGPPRQPGPGPRRHELPGLLHGGGRRRRSRRRCSRTRRSCDAARPSAAGRPPTTALVHAGRVLRGVAARRSAPGASTSASARRCCRRAR